MCLVLIFWLLKFKFYWSQQQDNIIGFLIFKKYNKKYEKTKREKELKLDSSLFSLVSWFQGWVLITWHVQRHQDSLSSCELDRVVCWCLLCSFLVSFVGLHPNLLADLTKKTSGMYINITAYWARRGCGALSSNYLGPGNCPVLQH